MKGRLFDSIIQKIPVSLTVVEDLSSTDRYIESIFAKAI